MKKITLFVLLAFAAFTVSYGQVSSYSFSQSSGTYTALTSPTILATQTVPNGVAAAALDDVNYNLALPFGFTFGGVSYASGSTIYVNTNGFLAFGSAAPTAGTYGPIGSTNVYAGALSAFGLDTNGGYASIADNTTGSPVLTITTGDTSQYPVGATVSGTGIPAGSTVVSTTATTVTISANCTTTNVGLIFHVALGQISSGVLGTAPNRKLVVQYSKMRTYNTNNQLLNFQIVLNETTNVVDFVYGNSFGAAIANTTQVGLRGATNASFTNRTSTTSWSSTTPGATNTSNITFSSTSAPAAGLTFTWTPPSCDAPSGLNVAPLATTSATVNWTASASAPNAYEYVLSTTNTTPTGAGTSISGTTVNLNALTPNTNYYFFIRSNCGNGIFSSYVSVPFFTGYCVPSSTSALTYIDSFSTSGSSTNIANNQSGYTNGGYQNNFSSTGVSAFAGGTINYSFTLVAGVDTDAGVAIWIDWNNNLNFELSERVYTSNGYILNGTYTGSIAVPSTATVGDYAMRIRTDYNSTNPDPCAVSFNRTEAEDYKVTIIAAPNDAMDFNNIQWVTDGTNGSNTSLTVPAGTALIAYAEGYEANVTEPAGAGAGVEAWIAFSSTNTNPNTWPASAWVAATYVDNQGNNDNFSRALTLPVGTNYVASRWRLNGAAFTYGGYNGTWNGTTNNSIQVIVSPIANDECSGATPFTYNDALCNGTNNNGTNVNATASSTPNPTCFNYGQNDVWYSFVVPAGVATVDVSTDFAGGTLVDTEIALYGGTCGALNFIACDQDSGTTVLSNGSSYNSIITNAAVTAGQTYYVRVSGYSASATGTFCLKASTNTLSNETFDSASFKFYPNPIKDVLNLSYSSVISKVQVVNLLGQEVFTKNLDSTENQIDLSTLSSGTYLVKVTSEGLVKTIKVIKE